MPGPVPPVRESLDTTTPGARLVFHVFAALAEFIRELIVQGTHEGLAAARARGERIGRPPAMTEKQVRRSRLADRTPTQRGSDPRRHGPPSVRRTPARWTQRRQDASRGGRGQPHRLLSEKHPNDTVRDGPYQHLADEFVRRLKVLHHAISLSVVSERVARPSQEPVACPGHGARTRLVDSRKRAASGLRLPGRPAMSGLWFEQPGAHPWPWCARRVSRCSGWSTRRS
ncbi:recombinase family protein [Streptomyces sp. NPDC058247]|uniref:recombinase family protein n=1 Tax=Streptomyces sp. NPDC058247 TaxID=3346401 RepID=UPI0036E4E596